MVRIVPSCACTCPAALAESATASYCLVAFSTAPSAALILMGSRPGLTVPGPTGISPVGRGTFGTSSIGFLVPAGIGPDDAKKPIDEVPNGPLPTGEMQIGI